MSLRSLRYPAAFLALSVLILLPSYFVFAQADKDGEKCLNRPQPLFHVGEVVEVNTSGNTILVKALRPNDDGDEEYVFITYRDDTVVNEDGKQVDESAIEVGDKIHAEGEVNRDSDEYLAEIDADRIHLFEELTPREVKREHRQENPESNSDIRE